MISLVTDRDRHGLVHMAGTIIIPPVYNTLGPVVKNRIRVQRGFEGPYDYSDCHGKMAVEATFQQAADFMSDRRARVINADGVTGTIDPKGNFREEPACS